MIKCAPLEEVSKGVLVSEFVNVTLPPERVVSIDIRKAMANIQAYLLSLPESLGKDPFPLKHSFADGLYIRELFIPKGYFCVGQCHKESYLNIVVKGDMSVLTEDGVKRISGAKYHVAPPGTKRFGMSHEDTLWITVHANPDNTTDIPTLENRIHLVEPQPIGNPNEVCEELQYFCKEVELIDKNLFDTDKFRALTETIFEHEKDGFWSDWSPEEQSLFMSGDWEAFSRSRGYTEEEISDLRSWIYMREDGERKGIKVLDTIRDLSNKCALRKIMIDEKGEMIKSSYTPSSYGKDNNHV